jgi:hypothetical protein
MQVGCLYYDTGALVPNYCERQRFPQEYTGMTRGKPTSVFNHIHYSISSSAWVFAYQLPPAANPLELTAREQYVVAAN